MKRWLSKGMLLVLLGALLNSATLGNVDQVWAQGDSEFELPPGVTWDDINTVARDMYCDVCEGIPLDECESIACRRWRQEIARLLGEGQSKDQIIDYFVARYGDDVAALPRDQQDLWLVFAVPAIIVVLFGVVGGLQVRQLRKKGIQAGVGARRARFSESRRPVPDDVDSEVMERLLRELEGYES